MRTQPKGAWSLTQTSDHNWVTKTEPDGSNPESLREKLCGRSPSAGPPLRLLLSCQLRRSEVSSERTLRRWGKRSSWTQAYSLQPGLHAASLQPKASYCSLWLVPALQQPLCCFQVTVEEQLNRLKMNRTVSEFLPFRTTSRVLSMQTIRNYKK